jgi:hypothetical protein
MPFVSTIRVPSEVCGAIVSLTEITTALAAESALAAGRPDAGPGTADGPFTALRP